MNNAIGKIDHFLAPYASQARSLADTHATPAMQHIQPKLQQFRDRVQEGFQHSTASIDASLHGLQPWQIAAVAAAVMMLTMWALSWLMAKLADVRETGSAILPLAAYFDALGSSQTLLVLICLPPVSLQ